MSDLEHVWAIVLAGGDGERVRAFFKDVHGRHVPKQFCPFDGHPPLVRWAIDRALRIVSIDHVVVALKEDHRKWWEPVLSDIDAQNRVVQPSNRGTAAGLLLPLLDVLARDPQARIVVFPSDHFVADEPQLCQTVVKGLEAVRRDPAKVALLGITPHEADSEYGWILPDGPSSAIQQVASFIEKPSHATARLLQSKGSLLNSLILVGAGSRLLHLYRLTVPELVDKCFSWHGQRSGQRPGFDAAYSALPSFDFSRQVLEQCSEHLAVVRVPGCGWTDLGTPERLRQFRDTYVQKALA